MLSWLGALQAGLAGLESRPVTVVLGNTACDMDSGVSSLVLASHRNTAQHPVIPVLNIHSQDFPLKTELVAALEEQNIQAEHLLFRDTIDIRRIPDLHLILVDHNLLSAEDADLSEKVVEIYDHHVKETDLATNCIIETSGSCSSIVLRQVLEENPQFCDQACLRLVWQTILLDTVNLQQAAKRVTPLDLQAGIVTLSALHCCE